MAGRRGSAHAHMRQPVLRRGERLLRWYRVVPVVLLVLTLAVVVVVGSNPTSLGRYLVYPVHHEEAIEAASERHCVDPLLVCAVIKCESDWDENARSAAGAIGLMQVMPLTAETMAALGYVDADVWDPDALTDPEVNIEYGCAYLGYLQSHLSSLDEVIAAYNAGIGAVQGWIAEGGTIPDDVEFAETRVYLDRVRNAYEGYQGAYPDGIGEL